MTWLDLLDAVQRLREMKVKACYDMVQTYTRDVPSCTVISQKPEIGTIVKSGQVIMLKMSRGPKVDRTPDFLGKNFDNAQSELLNDKNSLWDGLNI